MLPRILQNIRDWLDSLAFKAMDKKEKESMLREAKINVGLCFFNNGGTLYAFSGAYKKDGLVTPSKSIERLSKGQNSW